MIKNSKLLTSLFFTAIFTNLFINIPVAAVQVEEPKEKKIEDSAGINVDARSALLIEPTTGAVIFEKNSHEKFAPASVTKIMTMLIAMENIDNGKIKLTDKVTISENAKKWAEVL